MAKRKTRSLVKLPFLLNLTVVLSTEGPKFFLQSVLAAFCFLKSPFTLQLLLGSLGLKCLLIFFFRGEYKTKRNIEMLFKSFYLLFSSEDMNNGLN